MQNQSTIKGNSLSRDTRFLLQKHDWENLNELIDLHAIGVHYFDEDILPTWLSPEAFTAYKRSGLTPPNALPTYFPDNVHERIKSFLDNNYFNLHNSGLHHLGSEFNLVPGSEYGKRELNVCFVRITDYDTCDGSFGSYLVNNFIQHFTDNIFTDFAFLPPTKDFSKYFDNGIPLFFGLNSKRPISDFDIIVYVNVYVAERANIPYMLLKSGIPLYRWERHSHELPYRKKGVPVIACAGIGANFMETSHECHPIHGLAQNAHHEYILIGEGELLDLKFFQQYINTIKRAGGTKEDFQKAFNNKDHAGVYDPTKILFEYADKTAIEQDHTGKELSRKTFIGAGPIKNIHLIDEENQTKHCIAGPASEELQELLEPTLAFEEKVTSCANLRDYQQQFEIPQND